MLHNDTVLFDQDDEAPLCHSGILRDLQSALKETGSVYGKPGNGDRRFLCHLEDSVSVTRKGPVFRIEAGHCRLWWNTAAPTARHIPAWGGAIPVNLFTEMV